jgi:hypothetical protein
MRHAVVVAPRLQTLVAGRGTPGARIHDITFENLTFSYAGWNAPSGHNGYSSLQAGARLTGTNAWKLQGACDSPAATCPYGAFTQTPGNVTLTFDQRIEVRGDRFEHLGGVGLALGDGSQDGSVVGSLFTDISSSGLTIGGFDQPLARGGELVSNITVENNSVTKIGAEYHDAPAIVVGYAQYSSLVHNQIDDVPYSGISIGWGGWLERYPYLPPLSNYSRGNRIANNLIFDHMKTTADGGGIYTNGIEGTNLANAEVIENNVVLQQHSVSWGIYTDNGTMFVNIKNNAVYDAVYVPLAAVGVPGVSPYFSFGGCGGGPVAYDGNYSVQSDPVSGLISASPACGGHPLEGVTSTNNHVIATQTEIPPSLVAAAGIEAPFRKQLKPRAVPTGLPPFTQYP